MSDKPYTAVDIALAAEAIRSVSRCLHRAEWSAEAAAVLDWLAAAGRILPGGSQVHVEHEIDWTEPGGQLTPPRATSNPPARSTESDVPPVGGWGLWPTFRRTESIKERTR